MGQKMAKPVKEIDVEITKTETIKESISVEVASSNAVDVEITKTETIIESSTVEVVSSSDGPKENTVWPFQSIKEKTLDEEANLPPPHIDEVTGEWILNSLDVDCISVGAGILGCGGGGDPKIGRAMASQIMNAGKQIRVVDPSKLNKDQFGLATVIAFMGAPSSAQENLISVQQLTQCLRMMQNIIASGLCKKDNDYGRKEKDNIKLSKEKINGHDIWIIDVSTLPQYEPSSIPLADRITGLMPVETGGINSFAPLVAGAKVGLSILDADGNGRAFPELQMFLPFINGLLPFPSCVAGEKGNKVAISNAPTANDLESFFRMKCAQMGICALCIPPMTLCEVLKNCVLHTLSHAWQLGRAICRAKQSPCNIIIESIVNQQQGLLLLTGEIVCVNIKTEGGFTSGYSIIKGTGSFSKYTIQILFKNENFVVQKINDDGFICKKVPVVAPDLITVVNSDTGCPITTEDIATCLGLSVSVLVFPANPRLLTEKALPVVGPEGYQLSGIKYHKAIPLDSINE